MHVNTFTEALVSSLFLLLLLVLESSRSSVVSASSVVSPPQHNNNNNEAERDEERSWFLHPTDPRRRRRRLRTATTLDHCLLVLKLIDYEDHDKDDDVWVCEFPAAVAREELDGQDFLELTLPPAVLEKFHPISGTSILTIRKEDDEDEDGVGGVAYVEEALDTHDLSLYIPEHAHAAIGIEILEETHPRHYKARQRRRTEQQQQQHQQTHRRTQSTGQKSVLVVKVVDSTGVASPRANTLYDDWFNDPLSFKSGYEGCSKNQVQIEPANNGDDQIVQGILTVSIDLVAATTDGSSNAMINAAVNAARVALQIDDLSSAFDYVAVCQPVSGDWLAFAYANSYLSFYNGRWCNSVSTQMHEIGHNMGFGHSGRGDNSYGDRSSMMGYSYDNDDGPKMCFNAAKNYQLQWYNRQKATFDPLANLNTSRKFTMNGVDEYKVSGDTNEKLITLRLLLSGDTFIRENENSNFGNFGPDYYIGFNDAKGVNEGTLEGRNQILLFRKNEGGPDRYGTSTLLIALDVGKGVNINNWKGSSTVVTVLFESLTNNGRDANISIRTEDPNNPPTSSTTPQPAASPIRSPTASPVMPPTRSPTPRQTSQPTAVPTARPCFYDGNTTPNGGSLIGPTLTCVCQDGNWINCNENSNPEPTLPPAPSPTPKPTPVCKNSKDIVYVNKKGKKKKCNWVKTGKTLKIRKKRCISKKYRYLDKLIKENCPKACGEFAEKGICKNLFVSPFGKNKNK